MSKIDHLTAANTNYRNCIYSLAARDFNKAVSWITSALTHLALHLETKPSNVAELYARQETLEEELLSLYGESEELENELGDDA